MDLNDIMQVCQQVRTQMKNRYGIGERLAGHCIEASDLLVKHLRLMGFDDVHAVEGWVYYDHPSLYLPEAHTWVEVLQNSRFIYIDVTADQFNMGMNAENQFKPIEIRNILPSNLVY